MYTETSPGEIEVLQARLTTIKEAFKKIRADSNELSSPPRFPVPDGEIEKRMKEQHIDDSDDLGRERIEREINFGQRVKLRDWRESPEGIEYKAKTSAISERYDNNIEEAESVMEDFFRHGDIDSVNAAIPEKKYPRLWQIVIDRYVNSQLPQEIRTFSEFLQEIRIKETESVSKFGDYVDENVTRGGMRRAVDDLLIKKYGENFKEKMPKEDLELLDNWDKEWQ